MSMKVFYFLLSAFLLCLRLPQELNIRGDSLAGSERYEDSKAHDKQRMEESRENNITLMCLKDCVRAKAKAVVEEEGFVHIPFRSNKLTLLLKVSSLDIS